MNKFNHFTSIQIRFADIDSLGHVNNAKYFTYMEQARMNYFKDVVKSVAAWKEEGLILARASVDYISPLFIDDQIEVGTRCSKIGNKSLQLEYIIKKKDTETIVAKGSSILVAYDYKNHCSIGVPQEWKSAMSHYDQLNK
jgi:acyl-CoA thioester hydrolase